MAIRFFRFNNFERNRRHSKDFYGGDISSSSEVMPHGIGSALEGRPEILRMDQQNPWQPALPLNPHAQPEPAIPHAAQAPAAEELPIEGLLDSQWVTARENIVADLNSSLREDVDLFEFVQHTLAAAPEAPAPAEVPHDAPHPNFYPNPMVGGESLSQIYLRLLLTNKERAQPSSDKLFDKASSIFESKTLILHKMEALDPGGGWLSGGAKFIKNRRGHELTLDALAGVLRSLQSHGAESPYFRSFLSKRDRGD